VNEPRKLSWEATAVYRARVRGCLLGGAVGDALGYPIEFTSLDRIRATHGRHGVTGYVPGAHGATGLISDDTQMTLFTVEALVQAHERERGKGIGGAWPLLLRRAYERWLETQSKPGPERAAPVASGGGLITEAWLYSRRAPGNACLSGVAQMYAPDPWLELDGKPGPVNPDSKGCGTVMRSAPFGLVNPADAAFAMAARGARITHGHPTGYYAAGALAAIVAHLVAGDSLEGSVLRALRLLELPQLSASLEPGGPPSPSTRRPRPPCAGPSTWPRRARPRRRRSSPSARAGSPRRPSRSASTARSRSPRSRTP
jgi:ADP-ribosylglycohydrolase